MNRKLIGAVLFLGSAGAVCAFASRSMATLPYSCALLENSDNNNGWWSDCDNSGYDVCAETISYNSGGGTVDDRVSCIGNTAYGPSGGWSSSNHPDHFTAQVIDWYGGGWIQQKTNIPWPSSDSVSASRNAALSGYSCHSVTFTAVGGECDK